MAKLRDKIKLALDEARMLVLGCQILLGFEYRAVLEPGFAALPQHAQYAKLVALSAILVSTCLLMWPATYHQITEQGEDSEAVQNFTTRAVCGALWPFAVAFGLDVYAALLHLTGITVAAVCGFTTTAFAVFFWFGLGELQRMKDRKRSERPMKQPTPPPPGGTKLLDKIDQLLTESRVIIPGAQALLGFQFVAILMDGFNKLPASSQYVHIASLALMGIAMVLLMTPAAYHRIVENGEDTPRFYLFASRIILWSMVPLAAGLAGDFFVVIRRVTGSATLALAISAPALLLCYAAWFGYTLYRRQQQSALQRTSATAPPLAA
jgi:large-conductance mechanosensitive channel